MKLTFPSGWGFGSTIVWAATATIGFMLTQWLISVAAPILLRAAQGAAGGMAP